MNDQLIDGITGQIAMSGSGRYIGYISDARNVVAGDTNCEWAAWWCWATSRRRTTFGTGTVPCGQAPVGETFGQGVNADSDGNGRFSTIVPDGSPGQPGTGAMLGAEQ